MSKSKSNLFEIDFDSYILQSEPSKQENGKLWQTAIGLQQVDGLTPSKYLYETAKRNIDGEITIEEAKQLIDSYYETRQGRADGEDDAEEADKVSVRIREILAEKTFSFTPDLLLSIHKRLFSGVFYKKKAAHFRDYNISKREWVFDAPAQKAQTSIISTHANDAERRMAIPERRLSSQSNICSHLVLM